MSNSEKAKQAAHVLVDGVSVAQGGGDVDAIGLAVDRLVDIDAFSATVIVDDDKHSVQFDTSAVVGAAMRNQLWLIAQVAEARDIGFDEVIVELREYIDSL